MSAYQSIPGDDQDIEMTEIGPKTDFRQLPEGKNARLRYVGIGVAILTVAMIVLYGLKFQAPTVAPYMESEGEFDEFNRYIIRNFDLARPMSNFLNGIGGLFGMPMWAFYVNRGQGITSFGKQNKDSAIAKFVTAEKAYLQAPFTGFRTFLKGSKSGKNFHHMPFFPRAFIQDDKAIERNMMIGANEMEIEEIVEDLQLKTNVLYFVAPEQDFPSLVRSITFTNLDLTNSLELDVLDGLAQLIPNGLGNYAIDSMGRTMEAWMNVYNVGFTQGQDTKITMPFFHISQGTADSAQVQIVKDGFFVVSYIDGKSTSVDSNGLRTLLPFVVDPTVVFGMDTTLTSPEGFFKYATTVDEVTSSPQGTTSRTPCSFAGAKILVPPGENITITSIYGYAENLEILAAKYSTVLRHPEYSKTKRSRANEIVNSITSKVATKTSFSTFDAYVRQDFLDNVLRGGLPLLLGEGANSKVFHVYSRIHGDIERDYNYFQIDTTYFSQGPGNFRDVCQNRRLDVSHSPFVGDFNIRLFLSFIQADGFNPLTIASTLFRIPNDKVDAVIDSLEILESTTSSKSVNSRQVVKDILIKPFRPGQFFKDVLANGVQFGIDKSEVLTKIISMSVQDFAGQFNQNGYWTDHWTYILDLVDNYLTVYPELEEALLWKSEPIPFFVSPAVVRPRSRRFVPMDNPTKPGTAIVRAFSAIAVWGEADFGQDKSNAMNAIQQDPGFIGEANGAGGVWQRSRNGEVFKVSTLVKLLILGIIKFSTLDPAGMGIEMEGGKPGWNDAMNGLPGLLGSGMPETYEMLRILRYSKSTLERFNGNTVEFPIEFVDFLREIEKALDVFSSSDQSDQSSFKYWSAVNDAREVYRGRVVAYFDGSKKSVSPSELVTVLRKMEEKVQLGINKALSSTESGLSPTYFFYDCTNFSISTDGFHTSVSPKAFSQRSLPLFLEGPTRHLKIIDDIETRRKVYKRVRNSPLYDSALKMYTICESLSSMGQEVGRMKAFSPGWLENQSVWLHMSYKFYLELLRAGLYEEFFAEIADGLVPFMDHNIYGRSPLEAASFIVSSAFPDKKLHGASFLARLSGSTAEFLSMWVLMFAGAKPFYLGGSDNKLKFALNPTIPGKFFDDKNEVTFTFLGQIMVTYKNPSRSDTWKVTAKSIRLTEASGKVITVSGPIIEDEEIVRSIRDLQIASIHIEF